jgi:hypothetical protein
LLLVLRGIATLRPIQAALAVYDATNTVAIDDAMPAISIDITAWLTWPAHRQAQLAAFRRILSSAEAPNDVLVFATASRFASYLEPAEAAHLFKEQLSRLRQEQESHLYLAVALLPLAGRADLCEGLGAAPDLPTAYARSRWPQAAPAPPNPGTRREAFDAIVARCLSQAAVSSPAKPRGL